MDEENAVDGEDVMHRLAYDSSRERRKTGKCVKEMGKCVFAIVLKRVGWLQMGSFKNRKRIKRRRVGCLQVPSTRGRVSQPCLRVIPRCFADKRTSPWQGMGPSWALLLALFFFLEHSHETRTEADGDERDAERP